MLGRGVDAQLPAAELEDLALLAVEDRHVLVQVVEEVVARARLVDGEERDERAARDERAQDAVAQLEQKLGVLRGILEHPRREWSHRPVGALVLLLQLQAEEPLEQGR